MRQSGYRGSRYELAGVDNGSLFSLLPHMTISNQDRQFEQLVKKIVPCSKLVRTWPLKGGISAEMTAFEVERPDGQTQRRILRRPSDGVLQRNPHAAANEFRLLETLRSAGLATPTPYYLGQPGDIFPTPYLVVEYIEGKSEFAPSNLPDFILQLATHLARIHGLDPAHHDLSCLPAQLEGCTEMRGERQENADSALDHRRVRQVLPGARPLAQRNPSVLLHGDYWPGNLLWRDDRLVAVIDWEDARLGDPLIDLAISRLDILWIYGLEAMDAFTRHYQALTAIDYTDLPYWDLCAALRLARLVGTNLAVWAAFFTPYGRTDITEATIRECYGLFITQALEILAKS
jgi:aminoglycoside phosphotransferase (APT) family kinase protein